MKIFRSDKKKVVHQFSISDADRKWVDNNFRWFIKTIGYPCVTEDQLLLDNNSFPETLKDPEIKVENLIKDLVILFGFDPDTISHEYQEDLRDSIGIPLESHGEQFESETIVMDNNYTIHIAKSLLKKPKRLITVLIFEFIRIKLIKTNAGLDTDKSYNMFLYLAGVYMGFGVILSHTLIDVGSSTSTFWVTSWGYSSPMSNEVMTYTLALNSLINTIEEPVWIDALSKETGTLFRSAIRFINGSPEYLYNLRELAAINLAHDAYEENKPNNLDKAILILQKNLKSDDNKVKAFAYHNIGYYQTLKGCYEESILNFRLTLEIDPDHLYTYDNLGYSLIRIGLPEEGKKNIEKSIESGKNNLAYSYRNLALYHLTKKEYTEAEKFFIKAIENITLPVVFLEFHYAELLFKTGQTEKAMIYLRLAVEKGEPEAIKRMNEIELTSNPR